MVFPIVTSSSGHILTFSSFLTFLPVLFLLYFSAVVLNFSVVNVVVIWLFGQDNTGTTRGLF